MFNMGKILIFFGIFMVLAGVCFALTIDDNGYAWVSAPYEDKSAVGKELSKRNGNDYLYWIDMLDAFYSVDNWGIMSSKIKDVAAQISLPDFQEQDKQ